MIDDAAQLPLGVRNVAGEHITSSGLLIVHSNFDGNVFIATDVGRRNRIILSAVAWRELIAYGIAHTEVLS